MDRDFTGKKRAILAVLVVLVAADIALGVYSYQLAASPHTQQREFDAQNLKLQILRSDIRSAQRIKQDMPLTKSDCEKFEHSLPSQSVGSSTMTFDLDELAKKAGLQIVAQTYKQKEVESRNLTETLIDITVNGDYGSVARFMNGLQRSEKFYIVDGLTLSTENQTQSSSGALRVALHLRTYFREGA